MANPADDPGASSRRGPVDAKKGDGSTSSLGIRVAVAIGSAGVGGAIGGLILALGVGAFFPRAHVLTERWVCGPHETLEAGTEREGQNENYVVCTHGQTRVERAVEGRAFWVLSVIFGLLISGIVFPLHLRASRHRGARKAKRAPPDAEPRGSG